MFRTMRKGIWLTLCLLSVAGVAEAEVYKTVDENGNVVYTDRQPAPGAKPMELRGLTVVPIQEPPPPKAVRARPGQADKEGQVTDLGTLRRGYRDFRLVQPMPEQTFSGTGNLATVAWDTQYALQAGMAVIVSVDGQPMAPTTNTVITTERLDRGEHTVSATLVDSQGRTIASAAPVTFFIFQNSQLFNRPVAVPHGGGG